MVEVEDVVGGSISLVMAHVSNQRSLRLFGVLGCRELVWNFADEVHRDLALKMRLLRGRLASI